MGIAGVKLKVVVISLTGIKCWPLVAGLSSYWFSKMLLIDREAHGGAGTKSHVVVGRRRRLLASSPSWSCHLGPSIMPPHEQRENP
jgi:hypothetical protein